ncbi:hypothetical protein AXF14_01590 [Actinomyces radicidentis]|uniref:DUF2142 domain-containing protein n=1 Tax=Actinomyces radicidentis TaxID=111015 RepID=A0A0X8JDM8_ACTRD|nr:DUF2142 domain-containing protein [Actinomyces radicidentis]AMD86532.1 hypothetical protein AXF14_01590 [Actinomyces radicidentis]
MRTSRGDSGGSHGGRTPSRWGAVLAVAAMVLLMLASGLGWAVASPMGGAPDDDYHLGSIWCPRPAYESCPSKVDGDRVLVQVPEAVGESSSSSLAPLGGTCYSFRTQESAACVLTYSDTRTHWINRYDDGGYPGGFYRFHHLLVTGDPERSAVLMRGVNVLIATTLVTLLWLGAQRRDRLALTVAVLVSWVPMGVYFIASNNPSSWAVTGTFVYGAGMLLATRSHGSRRVLLLVTALIGALLCLATRYDTSFYLFVVAVALALAVPWNRKRLPEAVMAVVLALVGTWWMIQGMIAGRSAGAQSSAGGHSELWDRLVTGVLTAPKYVAGFYGQFWLPGWIDVHLDQFAPFVLGVLALGGCVMAGLARGSWRTWLSTTVVVGAMLGIPAVFYAVGLFPDIFSYQARYNLPLLAVAVLFLLVAGGERCFEMRPAQLAGICLCVVGGFALTMHSVMFRYVHGMDVEEFLNLDYQASWWWSERVPGPMLVWMTACVAFTLLVVAALWLSRRQGAAVLTSPFSPLLGDCATGASRTGSEQEPDGDAVAADGAGRGPAPEAGAHRGGTDAAPSRGGRGRD